MYAERIKNGFHRLGLALSTVIGVVSAMVAATGLYLWIAPLLFEPHVTIVAPSGKTLAFGYRTDPKKIGPVLKQNFEDKPTGTFDDLIPHPQTLLQAVTYIDNEFRRIDSDRETGLGLMLGSLFGFLASILIYAACRATGWVLAAFAGD